VSLKAAIQLIIGTILLWDSKSKLGPFLLGTAIIPVGDQGGALSDKVRGVGVTYTSAVLASIIGSISYNYKHAMLPLAFVVSFIMSMSFGPNVFMAGKIITIFFPVIIGMKPSNIGENVAMMALSGTFVVAWSIIYGELIGLYEGMRTIMYQSYNSLGHSISSTHIEQFAREEWDIKNIHHAPIDSRKILNTLEHIDWSRYNEATKKKIRTLVKALDFIRGAFICLLVHDARIECDEVLQLKQASGNCLILVAESCQFAWLFYVPHFKHRMAMALEEMDLATANVLSVLEQRGLENQVHLIQSIQSEIQTVMMNSLVEPWTCGNIPSLSHELKSVAKLPTHSPRKAIWVYCFRISITYTLAMIPLYFSDSIPVAYSHWFPMTVAIISTPGWGSTMKRVFHRTLGTFLGLAITALCMWLIEISSPSKIGVVIVAAILLGGTGFGVYVYYFANYGLATMFITAFVGLLSASGGASIATLTLWRVVFTLSGSCLYLLSMVVWRTKEPDLICLNLIKQAEAVHSYTKAVVEAECIQGEHEEDGIETSTWNEKGFQFDSSESIFNKRENAVKARLATMNSIADACLTPAKEGTYSLDPYSLAPAFSLELLILISVPAMLDMLRVDPSKRHLYVSERSLNRLLGLISRLEGTKCYKEEVGDDSNADEINDSLFDHTISRAHRRLDSAGFNLLIAKTSSEEGHDIESSC